MFTQAQYVSWLTANKLKQKLPNSFIHWFGQTQGYVLYSHGVLISILKSIYILPEHNHVASVSPGDLFVEVSQLFVSDSHGSS